MSDIEALINRAAELIDTSWHNSWHWKRDDYGYVPLNTWRTILQQANDRHAGHLSSVRQLARLIPDLEARIALMERREREEKEALGDE